MENCLRNKAQLEFSVFCIESTAERLGIQPEKVYDLLTKQSRILNGYIIPEYEMLHTQGKEYIVDDIIDLMREKGVCV